LIASPGAATQGDGWRRHDASRDHGAGRRRVATGYHFGITLCIYLRPELRIRQLAEEYAHSLAEVAPAALYLGPHALPHVTISHLAGVDDRAKEVWERARAIVAKEYGLDGPFYLSLIPFPDGSGRSYVRLELSRTPALAEVQDQIVELASELSAEVANLSGPAWRPHLTLAVVGRLPEQLPFFDAFTSLRSWIASPALGSLGRFRHVDRILETIPESNESAR
jgi:2'-5' RNA ligase